MKKGCKYGTHRVIEPAGVLPQPAKKISNDMEIFSNEIFILEVNRCSIYNISKMFAVRRTNER